MNVPTIEQLQATFARLGYPFFERGAYNVNTIAIRNKANDESGELVPDQYNDLLLAVFKDPHGQWQMYAHRATTIPGLVYFQQPMNKAFGTGVLVPGFYKGVYKFGKHNGLPALQQQGNFKVYRDKDRDNRLDLNEIQVCGPECAFNLHYYWGQTNVHNASAGCIVTMLNAASEEYNRLMHLYKVAADIYGNSFSLALIRETELV